VLFFLLARTLPNEKFDFNHKSLWFIFVSALLTMLVTISPFSFTGVNIEGGVPEPVPGPGLLIFAIFAVVYTSLTIYVLIKRIRESTSIEKHQLKFMMFGILLMLGLIILTIFIPVTLFKTNLFVSLLPIYALIFLLLTTYAIVRHHLFNLKVIATELTVIFLFVILLLNVLASRSSLDFTFNLFIFFATVGVGLLLIKGVVVEVKRREETARLAKKLNQANIRLRELDELKTEFMSIASHQLRTPLSVIKGYISLIEDGAYGNINKKTGGILQKMYESNEHLIKLVDEFLNITRMEQGRLKYSFVKTDLSKLIQNAARELRVKIRGRQLSLVFHNNLKERTDILLDAEKIYQVIYNFFDNAIKYTSKGSVDVFLEQEHSGLAVRVRDTGVGFDGDDGANFFQKFYRGKNVRNVEAVTGTGLGLYVARKFVEAHSGKIWARSKGVGKGSEFGFWLPKDPSSK
jgi:signal transduction histidine kinase